MTSTRRHAPIIGRDVKRNRFEISFYLCQGSAPCGPRAELPGLKLGLIWPAGQKKKKVYRPPESRESESSLLSIGFSDGASDRPREESNEFCTTDFQYFRKKVPELLSFSLLHLPLCLPVCLTSLDAVDNEIGRIKCENAAVAPIGAPCGLRRYIFYCYYFFIKTKTIC